MTKNINGPGLSGELPIVSFTKWLYKSFKKDWYVNGPTSNVVVPLIDRSQSVGHYRGEKTSLENKPSIPVTNQDKPKRRDCAKMNRNTAYLWLMGTISLVSLFIAYYSLQSVPNQVQKYVNAHKTELAGAQGPSGLQGEQGPPGPQGEPGAGGTNAFVPTACRNLNLLGPTPSYCQ